MNTIAKIRTQNRDWPEVANPGALRSDAAATKATQRLADQAAAVERGLTYQFPTTKILPALYAQVDVPAGLVFNDGEGAWFGLNVITAAQLGQGVQWTGLNCTLWPCDVAGTGRPSPFAAAGAGGYLAWGDTSVTTNQRNTHAYIVAGVNMPWVEYQKWRGGPRLAGQTQTTAQNNYAPQSASERRYVPFPPGLFPTTTTTAAKAVIENTLPLQIPITEGTTFAIALCIAPRAINNLGAAASLACAIDVTASFGYRYTDRVFTS